MPETPAETGHHPRFNDHPWTRQNVPKHYISSGSLKIKPSAAPGSPSNRRTFQCLSDTPADVRTRISAVIPFRTMAVSARTLWLVPAPLFAYFHPIRLGWLKINEPVSD